MNTEPQIAAVDVDYRESGAVAAAVWFRGWAAEDIDLQVVAHFHQVAAYQPGAFYLRELPCLVEVLARGPISDVVIVDGYVWLGNGEKGLGAHLCDVIGNIVVGVAKTKFASATGAIELCRGKSRSPLFISAEGMAVEEAAARIAEMQGPYRVPTLLKRVDALARTSET